MTTVLIACAVLWIGLCLTAKAVVEGSGGNNNSSHHNKSNKTADIYLLAYFWEPQSCVDSNSAGCDAPLLYWSNHFTIHGLWPQYSSGGYPSFCTKEPFDSKVTTSIGTDMIKYWPNIESTLSDPQYTSFWEHEWTKHGTCTGLTQDEYFQSTLSLSNRFGTPQSVTDSVGQAIAADKLRADFGGASYVALQCSKGAYLSGAYTCWSFENKIPIKQIECPEDVQHEDTCSAATITINSF